MLAIQCYERTLESRIFGYEQTCLPVVLSRLGLLGFPRVKRASNGPQFPPRRTGFLLRTWRRRSFALGKTSQCSYIFCRVNGIRVVLPKGLLPAIKSPLVPFQGFGVLSLIPKYYGHIVDRREGHGVAVSKSLLLTIKSPLIPL